MGRISGEAFTLYAALGAAPPAFLKISCRALRGSFLSAPDAREGVAHAHQKQRGCSLFSAPLSSARDSLQAHAFKWWLLAMLGAKMPLCVALVPPAAHLKP